MIGLERPLNRDVDVVSLFGSKLGQLNAQLFKVQARHFFVELETALRELKRAS